MGREGLEKVLKRLARPGNRSPLFWWMIEHHAELRTKIDKVGRKDWIGLCDDFAQLGLTLMKGKPASPELARQTWRRVELEIKRMDMRSERERAEREARRAVDPRRNMPSRFPKGVVFSPEIVDQPARPGRALVSASPAPPAPVAAGSATADEERITELPADLVGMVVPDFDGTPLGLLDFFRPLGQREPWDDIEDEENRKGTMISVILSRARRWSKHPMERLNWRKWDDVQQ